MQCISRHLQLTFEESALCCSCLEPLFSLGSQTACTPCTFSTLPGVIVPGTGSQPSYTASSEQAPIHFTAENSKSGTRVLNNSIMVSRGLNCSIKVCRGLKWEGVNCNNPTFCLNMKHKAWCPSYKHCFH